MSGFPSFKEHIFQGTPFSGCSKYSIYDMENKTEEFKLRSMFKPISNGKGMVYGPNGKGIIASLEYTLIIYSPNGKGMAL